MCFGRNRKKIRTFRKGAGYSRHVFLKSLFITLICYLIFFAFLFCGDKFYDIMDNIVEHLLGRGNHFSGEAWYTTVAASVAALPGILCGVLALLQTQKLHKLEARYHRPAFVLRHAWMRVIWIHSCLYSSKGRNYRRAKYEKWAKGTEENPSMANLLTFEIELEVKNDITVLNMIPEQVIFQFPEENFTINFLELPEKWTPYRSVIPKWDREKYLLCISWELFPYEIEGKTRDEESKFWESMERFTNYGSWCNVNYKSLLTELTVRVYYEYAPVGYERVTGRLFWKVDEKCVRQGAEVVRSTNSGIFTYMV